MDKIKNYCNKAESLLLYFIIIYFSFSPMNNLLPFSVFAAICGLLLFLKFLDYKVLLSFIKKNICFIVFMVFVIIKALFAGDYHPLSEYHSFYGLFGSIATIVIAVCSIQIISNINIGYKIKYIKIFFLLFHLSIIIGLVALVTIGNVYRYSLYLEMPLLPGVNFIFSSTVVAIFLFYHWLFIRKNIKTFFLFLLNFIFVLLSAYTTQIIFLLVALFFLIIKYYIKDIKKILIGATILLLITLLFRNYLGILIINVINTEFFGFLHPDIVARISDIGKLLSGDIGSTVDLIHRFNLSFISIDTFFNYPLFGIPFSNYNTVSINVGGHAQWFDCMARYGIFGCSLLLMWLWKVRDIFIMKKSKNYCLIGIVILYGFFNPVVDGGLLLILSFSSIIITKNIDIWRKKDDNIYCTKL